MDRVLVWSSASSPSSSCRAGGFVITAILGLVGALVGGFVGRLIGWYGEGNPVGFIMAVMGSTIVLAVYCFTIGRIASA